MARKVIHSEDPNTEDIAVFVGENAPATAQDGDIFVQTSAEPTFWEQAAVEYWHGVGRIGKALEILCENGQEEAAMHGINVVNVLSDVIPMACPVELREHIGNVLDDLYRAAHGPTPQDQEREFMAMLEQLMAGVRETQSGPEALEPLAASLGD